MDEYYRILDSLPPALRTPLGRLDARCAPHVQEIRLRLGQPIQFTIRGRLCPAAKFLPGAGLPAAMEADMLRDCFLQLCRRSVYAYEDELQQGYFTVQGGCRIGVAGCRGPGGFSAVTSLNLRIARWITCPLPPALEEAVAARAGGLLLAGPPGSGKTTLLRSIVQRLCESDFLVSVIDERGELMACETGSLPRAAQIRCDVYARCTKPEGIAMALRCMNPQILVCDELGTAEDAQAVAQGVASGVVFFATVHCDTPAGLHKSPRWPHCWPQAPLQKPPFCPGVPIPAPWHSGSHCDSVAAMLRAVCFCSVQAWAVALRRQPISGTASGSCTACPGCSAIWQSCSTHRHLQARSFCTAQRAARNLQTSARRVLQLWQICSFHPACPRPCGAKPCRRFAVLRNPRA